MNQDVCETGACSGLHLIWDKGLHLDLVAIKCEVSHACGTPTDRKVSWANTRLLSWAQIFQTKSAIKAERDSWASCERTTKDTSKPLWGYCLGDKTALLGTAFCPVFSLTQPAQVKALQTAVVMCWSCALLSLDFPIYLCPGQALLLVETSDLGED